jgi:hypothetical protein
MIYKGGFCAMAKRRKSKTKRTITPEHQAKMQAGRKAAAVHQKRVSELYKSGVAVTEEMTRTERMLNSVKRR